MQIIECVPNFSEGRDKDKISEITEAMKAVPGVKLLDVDPGPNTNRTVVTIIGEPEAVCEAAFRGIKKAGELIDMRFHKGEHPRFGATDVCPLVPISGITMNECAVLAKKLGERVAAELEIPVYLYEEAATSGERKNLAYLRQGEYESLEERFSKGTLLPDYCLKFNPKSGATAIGAREFLIAFNVNINSRDAALATKIANLIRESGTTIKNEVGKKIHVPGRFKKVKATGWYIEAFKTAQISMNLTDYKISPPHLIVEAIRDEASKLGIVVTGCELVGLIPKNAMTLAGKFYLERQKRSTGVSEKELIDIAVRSMGLNELYPFKPEEKIIEYQLSREKEKLVRFNLKEFCDELASDSPAPGGGSIAALSGALSAGLSSMVANLTYRKKGFKKVKRKMRLLAERCQEAKEAFLTDVDRDTEAFNRIMQAFSLTGEEKKKALETATLEAIFVPLEVMKRTYNLLKDIAFVAKEGNQNSLSDAGVSLLAARTAIEGAYMNVLINLKSLKDKNLKVKLGEEATTLKEKSISFLELNLKEVYARLL